MNIFLSGCLIALSILLVILVFIFVGPPEDPPDD